MRRWMCGVWAGLEEKYEFCVVRGHLVSIRTFSAMYDDKITIINIRWLLINTNCDLLGVILPQLILILSFIEGKLDVHHMYRKIRTHTNIYSEVLMCRKALLPY